MKANIATTQRIEFPGHSGDMLAARLELPAGTVRATAVFAHCFTCSKDFVASRRIASELSRAGIAVLRFDFTGLGSSDGDFANTNFSSNVQDLVQAANYLRENYLAPSLLIGHSLGGAAALVAAGEIDDVKAVVTIGTPGDVQHVTENFGARLDEIKASGEATVSLAGRSFTIKKQFLDDLESTTLSDRVEALKKPLLILHSPIDDTVGIENATSLFVAARHPKSFVSLDTADHLLTRPGDAEYAARAITGWAERYLPADPPRTDEEPQQVRVTETLEGKFQNVVQSGRHRMMADEPESYGGLDSGPSPYDFLSVALATCTGMTLRVYAGFKKLDLGRISVDVSHRKIHAKDCEACVQGADNNSGKIDQFSRLIHIEGEDNMTPELRAKVLEIADKCPVHRTLERSSHIETALEQ